jgi:fermentation-respiration switch protein FrsA (DUF1100 family)
MPRHLGISVVITTIVLGVLVTLGLRAGSHPADADKATDPGEPGPHRVATAVYNLGDTAFHAPGFDGPIELTGVVHYPVDLADGAPHPLVLFLHGSWAACEGIKAYTTWPCPASSASVPSYRGYDYLGEHLASRGYIAVSISANGINAAESGNGYVARSALINEHLRMWQQLSATGRSPLAGKFVDPDSGKPVKVDFTHQVDLTNVGTVGHSRGGQGVMEQASDARRQDWPDGVQVKAVLGIAPTTNGVGASLVTSVPLMTIVGSCDGAIQPYTAAESYLDAARGKNQARDEAITVPGANHNFFNTTWSPSSGLASATDDSPETAPGTCTTSGSPSADVPKLTEQQQRRVALTYVTAFFDRYLRNDSSADALLTGDQRVPGLAPVEFTIAEPS